MRHHREGHEKEMTRIRFRPAQHLDLSPAVAATATDWAGEDIPTEIGDNEAEAIGKLMLKHPARFGIEEIDRDPVLGRKGETD